MSLQLPAAVTEPRPSFRELFAPKLLTILREGDAAMLLATFGLTVFRDLTEGIVVGCAIGAILMLHRMAQTAGIEEGTPLVSADRSDTAEPRAYDAAAVPSDLIVRGVAKRIPEVEQHLRAIVGPIAAGRRRPRWVTRP
jgi:MFS superfamily sulfate permease-like transporter